ncbi:MAG: aspartate-semialdehyde dehydrogenase [bacterium]|jgi:aspartate-semialdehyde dehydrogenase|nr:aspartate-semialdehyde dehydrogenase [bacterium]MDD4152512.1 aspartate-semialdehyde dehydrogenase [bacterium]MDD4558616.1 aspartate-semialdehyde dehydrogenase [bacterium]
MPCGYRVAIVGATGAVGRKMIEILIQRDFPIAELVPLATSRSAGTEVEFKGKRIKVEETSSDSFDGVDIALFAGGGSASRKFGWEAVARGAVVIDNSSLFRMEENVPLVIPEVNPQDLKRHKGLIANPNCSTIQMVMVLKPIYDAVGIKRVVVSTYQAVSGTGKAAIDELDRQTKDYAAGHTMSAEVYPYQIALNVLPQIDAFTPNGYTKEEMKMVNETRKILGDNSIAVSATTVRVPVFHSHSEAINVQTEEKLTAADARMLLSKAPGVRVIDNSAERIYPMPVTATGKDDVMVGRIREDISVQNGLDLWVVADNLRKGAALNAVQIAEKMIELRLI